MKERTLHPPDDVRETIREMFNSFLNGEDEAPTWFSCHCIPDDELGDYVRYMVPEDGSTFEYWYHIDPEDENVPAYFQRILEQYESGRNETVIRRNFMTNLTIRATVEVDADGVSDRIGFAASYTSYGMGETPEIPLRV